MARTSFGRQEPPKANPGFRYVGEMLSLVSAVKISTTDSASTPSSFASVPTSLANETFTACHALQTYFVISAERNEVSKIRPGAHL